MTDGSRGKRASADSNSGTFFLSFLQISVLWGKVWFCEITATEKHLLRLRVPLLISAEVYYHVRSPGKRPACPSSENIYKHGTMPETRAWNTAWSCSPLPGKLKSVETLACGLWVLNSIPKQRQLEPRYRAVMRVDTCLSAVETNLRIQTRDTPR